MCHDLISRKLSIQATMAACEKTLETYELLENILANLDPLTIQTAKRVSKSWQALILRSKTIQYAMVLRSTLCPPNQVVFSHSTPYYDFDIPIKLHPALSTKSEQIGDMAFQVGSLESRKLTSHLTYPPTAAIGLFISGYLHNVYCIVYSPQGVRFQDVRDVQKMVRAQLGGAWSKENVRSTLFAGFQRLHEMT